MTSNGEESSPTRTIIGDNRPNESASTTTTTNSPSQAVPATRQRTRKTTGEATKPRSKNKKRLRDFLRKTIFYSQNIHGSGKNKKENTGPYKFEYITSLMKEKGIDVYLVQETWLPNDFEREINGTTYSTTEHQRRQTQTQKKKKKKKKKQKQQQEQTHQRGDTREEA